MKMADEFYRLKLVLSMQDRLTARLKKIDEDVKKFEERIEKTETVMKKFSDTKIEPKFDTQGIEDKLNKTNDILEKIAKKTVEPKIKPKDDTEPTVKKVEGRLKKLTSKAWDITIKLKDKVSSGFDKVSNTVTTPLGMLGIGAGAVGISGLLTNSAKKSMDFTAEISNIKALTGMQGADIELIRQRALELGKSTKFSALEAAQGMTELLKAGINVKDVLGDASQSALDLAAAGDLSLPEAAEIMSTSMNAFKMNDSTKVANLLAGAANASATDVREMKYALSQVSNVAGGLGLTLDDVSTGLAVFAQNALKGSDAGTSMKTMLQRLIPTTKPAIEAFEKVGLLESDGGSAFYDASGKIKSMEEIAELLHNSMKNFTEEQQSVLLNDMFGSDAIRGGLVLIKEGAEGIRKMRQEMTKFTASSVALEKLNNAKGSIEQLRGAFETFQIEVFAPLEPAITKIANAFTDLLSDTEVLDSVKGRVKDVSDSIISFIDELSGNEQFQQMQWGDKIVFILDKAMEAVDKWASGSGGEQFGKVMTKLAEIGIKAFVTALLGMMKASLTAIFEGNFSGALALALGASFMGGGKLLSGLFKVGNNALDWGKNATGSYSLGDAYTGTGKGIGSGILKKLPVIGAFIDGYRLVNSDDKLKIGTEIASGWGGAIAGGKAGAALGSVIAPGVGTVIGGLIGSIGGYALGSDIGAGVVDFIRNGTVEEKTNLLNRMNTTTYNPYVYNSTIDNTSAIGNTNDVDNTNNTFEQMGQMQTQTSQLQIETNIELWNNLKNTITDITVSVGEQINSFSQYASQGWTSLGQSASTNLELIRYGLLQAEESIIQTTSAVSDGFGEMATSVSDWCSSIVTDVTNWFSQIPVRVGTAIDEAVARANSGLSNLKTSAWNALPTPLQNTIDWGAKKLGISGFANGGFLDKDQIIRVAEGNNSEVIIPLHSSKRSRGLSLWKQAGEILGVDKYFSNENVYTTQSIINYGTNKLAFGGEYANGGFLSKDQLIRVSEGNRSEVIIPLHSSKRSRGLSLWKQAGEALGINSNLFTNITNNSYMPALAYAMSTNSNNYNGNGSADNSYTFNGMNINIGNNKSDEEMATTIGWKILNAIKQSYQNRG
jgi:TP901 family phage tail tape measure protein